MLTRIKTKLHIFPVCVSLLQPHAVNQMRSSSSLRLIYPFSLITEMQSWKKTLWGRQTYNTSSVRGIKTDKQSNNQTSGLQKYHTHRRWKSRSALWQRPYEPWQNVWKKILWPVNKLSQPYLCCGMWNKIFSLPFTAFPLLSSRNIQLWHCSVWHLFYGQAVDASAVQASRFNSIY